MKVTLKDIAQKAGVSVNTASLALRDMPSVKQETKERIRGFAKELGYFTGKDKAVSHTLAVISTVERLRDSYFYMSFQQHILSAAQDYGYNLMVFQGSSCDIEPNQLRETFAAAAIAGIIVLGDMEERIVDKVAQCGIPLIATGTRYEHLSVCTVIEDNLRGAFLAVRHLYERGFRQIGFLGQPLHSTGFMERYEGFVGAMHAFGLEARAADSVLGMDAGNVYDYSYIQQALGGMEHLPEAFLCANDNLAIIALKALRELGMSVPKDMALLGFDNSAMGKMVTPAITSVDVRCAAQAERCVMLLAEHMRGTGEQEARIVMPVNLVEGESVGAPPKRFETML